MTVFLAFTTGLFGGILLGVYLKPIIKGLSNVVKENESEKDLLGI